MPCAVALYCDGLLEFSQYRPLLFLKAGLGVTVLGCLYLDFATQLAFHFTSLQRSSCGLSLQVYLLDLIILSAAYPYPPQPSRPAATLPEPFPLGNR